ncbi:hypothetical protein DV515_00006444 [Chloebia gouldiae]|uniref:Uncharacterized protein n=1 Tax=Chloebia gouldiae TaxID=44316 RepID=A0A3L8SKS9_CHLGU|nr:hypothetical protein DV515_00006444 [Chloebia gouldiae]
MNEISFELLNYKFPSWPSCHGGSLQCWAEGSLQRAVGRGRASFAWERLIQGEDPKKQGNSLSLLLFHHPGAKELLGDAALAPLCYHESGSDLHGHFDGHGHEANVSTSLTKSCSPVHATAGGPGLESAEHLSRMGLEECAQSV